jgi:type I restriction enzyme, S subunit
MRLKQYPKYKDSGVQWIGDIPEEWDVQRGKFQFKVTGGYAFPSEDFVEEGISLVRIGDVSKGTVDLENCKKLPEEYELTKKDFLLNEKEVLVAMTGATIGKIGQVPKTDEKMLLNQRVGRIKTKFSPDYYKYVLTADFVKEQIRLIAEGAAQENISSEQIESFVIPQLDEKNQKFISSFLDSKTSQLDQTIGKDKLLIELLKEKRTALINHVVTKGLDKNAKMKKISKSVIDEIPEMWSVFRFKDLIDIRSRVGWRDLSTNDYIDEGPMLLGAGDITIDNRFFKKNDTHIPVDKYDESPEIKVKKDDVLLVKVGATIGRVAIINEVNEHQTINAALFILRCYPKIIPKYLYYLICADFMNEQITLNVAENARGNLFQRDIKKIFTFIPLKDEQIQIIKYLDKEISKINPIIKKIEEKINLMEEYRKSLIHHVVTGKVDVSGVEA